MSREPDNIIEEKIRLECSNCGQDTYVTGRVAEMWEFYNKHKTRIGNSYCHKDHLHLHVIEHNKSIQSKEREYWMNQPANEHDNAIRKEERERMRERIIALITTHTEHDGSYCDTGEDMDWSCRSECTEMAVKRINDFFRRLQT